jgi:hypothetical protein
MDWKRLLAGITGSVDEERLWRHERPLPPRSPNLNAIAERWVRSVKSKALSRFTLFGKRSLSHVLSAYLTH